MANVLQFNLSNYIEGHQLETAIQDDDVIVFIPVFKGRRQIGSEAHVVDNYRTARKTLSYAMVL